MKPDKHKKKDFFDTRHGDDRGDIRYKQPNPNNIKDEDELNELPSKAPTIAAYGGRHYSNAFLRLLRSNIGKRWDDVYSILSEKLGNGKDDIKWYIDQHAYKREDGVIVSIGNWGESEVRGFYVMDGVLGEQRTSLRYKRDGSKVKVTYVDGFIVFKHNDIYFKAPLDKSIPSKDFWWYGSSADYSRTDHHIIYTDRRKNKCRKAPQFAIPSTHIRQLSSKEIMHWKLPNTEINQSLGMFF